MSAHPSSPEWLREKGIDRAIWAARGCRRYEQGDASVKDEFRPFLPRSRLGTVTKVVNRSAGWLMPKHPPPGSPPIPPQLRPDDAVIVDDQTTWHYHGPATFPKPTFPEEAGKAAGKYLPKKLCMFGVRADAHVNAPPKDGEGNYDRETGLGAHNGVPLYEVHKHAPSAAKYVLLAGKEGEAKRIDLHPLARRLLPDAEVVFFVLEGTPKTDAVLSAGGVAFGVPSVTCWTSEELITFAHKYLRGKTVLVVPDGDWFTNWQVERQALKIRTLLRRRGIEAHVCAPPYDAEPFHKAVDDHLGAGKTLGELVIEGREPPIDRIREAVSTISYQRRQRAAHALEDLSLYVDQSGRLELTFLTLKRLLAYRHSHRFVALLESLQHTFTVERGSLVTEQKPTFYGRYTETVWRETPTTINLDEYYRSYRTRQKLLAADFWERAVIQGLRDDVDELKRLRRDHDAQREEPRAGAA
jgi:hypothetical protein